MQYMRLESEKYPALYGRHVHVDDVAVLQHGVLVRKAVADDVVDGGAHAETGTPRS
jgi:hypothetical protein